MKPRDIEWKTTLIKSLIYRGITLILGTITAYALTRSIAIATTTALLTEAVQAVNYFIYELIWSNLSRKKLEEEIIQKIKNREINLKIGFSSILDLAYQLSQIDTFVPKLYLSTLNIFNKMLENPELEEIRDEIEKYRNHFKNVHSKRKMFFISDKK
ncbi:MAG: DUF2061 domain-containing protein [Candidatus Hermodarchaeota archaeon]